MKDALIEKQHKVNNELTTTATDLESSTTNNFDLIRLFAASQVAIEHAAMHLQYDSVWIRWVSLFPGVPIFFFISGFLIYSSYVKSISDQRPLVNFYTKRALRLYPGLWFCLGFSVALVWMSGYLDHVDSSAGDFAAWALTSGTLFQFYNPAFLREFGLGVINGSLWTISVELQFYILTPLIFFLLKKKSSIIMIVMLLFCAANVLINNFNTKDDIAGKLIEVSFVPWIYMFIVGALFAKYSFFVNKVMKYNIGIILFAYIAIWYISNRFELIWGNEINPIGYLILIFLIIKLAFSHRNLSDKILKRNDLSYGIYIFHMPVINFFIYKNYNGFNSFVAALIFTFMIALGSWFLIERPFLRLKRHQLRRN